ncbi:LPS biosynthesis glycosyltransferase-like protein [Treponema primitia ZAS-2]|uniref:LPS biosynthesis glycosyltransferase-like protein n=1 Tax=Treponema primitia (strain ATCC BAA-887 / DSM 12427 / ZAS-2) TaxID=545694 RepID=F5YQ97_TREPZ|nr:glycosyltransferase family 4 protein [Treponema primitia]AEF85523.1 LPS biosynthesis glycosyltransferase-like protein [Treponema primitia ZAS-2]
MNIAFILPSLANKAPIKLIASISNYLTLTGNLCSVFYFDNIVELQFNCKINRISMKEKIEFDKYDIIHSNMYRPDKYLYHWRKEISNSKVVSTLHCDIFHDLYYTYKNILFAKFFENIWIYRLKYFDKVICISQYVENIYKNKMKNTTVIYNGVEINKTSNFDLGILNKINKCREDGYKLILCYAYITKRKGLVLPIQAIKDKKDYVLFIIGDGPEKKKLIRLVKLYQLTGRVFFFSQQFDPYLYLKYFDLFIMPSINEGFGLALVEAILMGKPCICSDIEIFKELFSSLHVTFFNLENINSLKSAIDYAYKYGLEKAEVAKEYASKYYMANSMCKKYYEYYNYLLS